jgi:hypothetical protein
VLLLLLTGLGGEGEGSGCPKLPAFWRWLEDSLSSSSRSPPAPTRFSADKAASVSTSTSEACSRHRYGCSNSLQDEVIRSPPWMKGPWQLSVARRRLLSSWSLLLGGNASRTPAKGVRATEGPDCFPLFCSRVVSIKSWALSLDRRFPRAYLEKALLNFVPDTSVIWILGVLPDPGPTVQKNYLIPLQTEHWIYFTREKLQNHILNN